MTRYLYNLAVSEDVSRRSRTQAALNLAANAPLNSDVPDVDSLSAEPGSRTVDGVVAGEYAGLQADEFEELFGATGIEVVPWWGDQPAQRDGYYALENVNVRRPNPREDRLQIIEGSIQRAGTRGSHYRALYTNPQPADNAFGSSATAEVGLSAAATDVAWWDKTDGSREGATVQRTVTGEHGQIDVYDATEPAFDAPVLLHDIAYGREWETDARVWDDFGRAKTATTASGATVPTWQRCFVSGHQFDGSPVIESDVLRLTFNVSNNTLSAARWDDAAGDYNAVSLGTSDWQLAGVTPTRIGMERVTASTLWRDATSGDEQRLTLTLRRGAADALWLTPPNETAPPQGLIDRLSPVATDAGQTAAEVVDIVPRSEADT